jgi:hypothetical protein
MQNQRIVAGLNMEQPKFIIYHRRQNEREYDRN